MSMDVRRDRAIRVAKALGDPTRFELLRSIAERREICCRDLVALFRVSQATVSHHLKILSDARLVSTHRDGQFSYFRIRPGALDEYGRALGAAFGRRAAAGKEGRRSPGRASATATSSRPASRVPRPRSSRSPSLRSLALR